MLFGAYCVGKVHTSYRLGSIMMMGVYCVGNVHIMVLW